MRTPMIFVEQPKTPKRVEVNKVEPLTDKSPMPYGKHRGVEMANVPADYLLWMRGNIPQDDDLNKAIRAYIEDNIELLEEEVKHAR